MLKFARMEGFDVAKLSRGLSFSAKNPWWPGAGVAWDEVTELFARLESCHPEALRRFAAHYVDSFPLFTWVATYVLSPEQLYRLTLRGWSRVWPLRLTVRRTSEGLEIEGEGPPGLRCGAPIYRLGAEILRLLPSKLDHEPARVEYHEALPRFVWRVTLPRPGGAPRGGDDDRADFTFEAMVNGVLPVLAPPSIPTSWALTPAEARVVDQIVGGLNVKQIAHRLCIDQETVRTHLKRAMAKAGVHRQAELVARVLGTRTFA